MTPAPPHRSRLLAAGLLLAALAACGPSAPPEQLLSGTITDNTGAPLPDAAVALREHVALTGPEGTFQLVGVEPDEGDVFTAAARGFIAWSFEASLNRFAARLQRRREGATALRTRSITLRLPGPAPVDRTVFLSLGNGQLIPVFLFVGNDSATLDVPVAEGDARLSAIAPPPGPFEPAWSAPPRPIGLDPVEIDLVPVEPGALRVQLNTQAPPDDDLTILLTCIDDRMTFVAARAELPGGDDLDDEAELPLLLDTAGARCDLVASWTVNTGQGPALHVAFTLDLDGATLDGASLDLDLPRPTPLDLDLDLSGGLISWTPVQGATVYDVFLAPDDGDRAGSPIWSGTTDQTSFPLPALPPEAVARIAFDPRRNHLLRVVARIVPGLDLRTNWSYATYRGYVASPWVPIPASALDGWHAP